MEFEDGEIIMHSPAPIRHQDLVRFLTILLAGYVERHHLGSVFNGPAVVRLRPGLDDEPDIFFITTDQLKQLEENFFPGAPALIIEVVSSGSRSHDLERKAAHYCAYGVAEYWAVDGDRRTLFQHPPPKNQSDRYLVAPHREGRVESRMILGFWIDVRWLGQDPLPGAFDCLDRILSG